MAERKLVEYRCCCGATAMLDSVVVEDVEYESAIGNAGVLQDWIELFQRVQDEPDDGWRYIRFGSRNGEPEFHQFVCPSCAAKVRQVLASLGKGTA